MTKITESSLELAAQCWCDEDTSSIEMNSRLAIAFAKRLDAKDERIAELEKEQRDAVDREQGLITALDNLQTLQKKCQSLESALITVRGILNSQSDKSCLGTGSTSTGDCAPWSIVDEVVHGITQALKEAK